MAKAPAQPKIVTDARLAHPNTRLSVLTIDTVTYSPDDPNADADGYVPTPTHVVVRPTTTTMAKWAADNTEAPLVDYILMHVVAPDHAEVTALFEANPIAIDQTFNLIKSLTAASTKKNVPTPLASQTNVAETTSSPIQK